MRFDTNKHRSTRNYSSRREQLKLLLLFVPLALVIILMSRLRDPKTADTVNNLFSNAHQPAPIKPRPVVAGSASSPEATPSLPPTPTPNIRPDLLKTIEDNTYFRTTEKDAWFHFFEFLQKGNVDPAQAVYVEYVQLVDQPNVYRGKLVTVSGTARQITKEKPAANDLGLASYYRVVIQPSDGANWPIIVYCLELPKGVSPGDDLAIGVRSTGLFFKKLSYKWQDGLGIAPVIVAKSVEQNAGTTASVESQNKSPADWTSIEKVRAPEFDNTAVEKSADPSTTGQAAFQKILSLSGWDAGRLAKFDEGQFLSDAQRIESLELLRRLRSIDSTSLNDWSLPLPQNLDLNNLDTVRGQLRRLYGRVTKVTKRTPDSADAARLEMSEYFECELQADNLASPAKIITARVPKDWLKSGNLNEPTKANVLFVKRMTDETPPRTLWLAKEIAWYPGVRSVAQPESLDDLFRESRDALLGKSMLGAMAVDVGQLDLVGSRGRIRPQERDIFYHMLYAVGQVKPSTLVRIANDNLPTVKQAWGNQTKGSGSPRRTALAHEVVRRANEGRYSVAMLFNDPEPQTGRLFVFDGIARRAVRVEVGERYLIDHYYELEVFTDDSQNYPLIFCVRELPEGFPVGADIRVPVRVAGFFFKNWLYSTRGGQQQDETADGKASGPRAQFAPLLIGASPIVLPAAQSASHAGRFVLGGLFVLGLIGIWVAAVRFARDDRRFRENTPAASFLLPPGQSLNDLNLPTAEVPMMIQADSTPSFDESSK